jgi:hypothetical protein
VILLGLIVAFALTVSNELQLDFYKINLSGVVSKYIVEIEKNLSKIFNEAESSNVYDLRVCHTGPGTGQADY